MSISTNEIPTRFDFNEAQQRIYQMWVEGGHFHSEPDSSKKPFTIVIPPPNVTGALHLGHALNNTLQDVIIRFKRMQGFNTLWMPGTDHAGIATQARVEKRIKELENKTRHDIGRENLVQRIWDWKDEYEKRILNQLKQMGCSCDWDRTRFTLDETCAKAVRFTFFDLFNKDLIYRGKRLVNWDTHLETTVSDDEVENKKTLGHFWHFQYPFIDPKPGEPTHVMVATTRPETMLGDTAVAVHPDPASAFAKVRSELNIKLGKSSPAEKPAIEEQIKALDERKAEMLPKLEQLRDMANDGRMIMLPLMDREIPLVTDTWAKPELGSGCVKITPAHDPNDYEVAKRCDLPMISIMNLKGKLNVEAGKYEGLYMKQGRKQVVEDLEQLGLLDKVEDREIELPISDRSKQPIEPMLADQWFVRMDSLAQSAMDAVEDKRVTIIPQRYAKGYLDWLGEKRDWPVSRQLWWGHQIPVWSKACETQTECDELTEKIKSLDGYSEEIASVQIEPCEETDDEKRKKLDLPFLTVHVCIKAESDPIEPKLNDLGLVREVDVLDTWFSSALWPHSTLGWPEKTDDLKHYYPTSTLITSRDIISLWVARMVLMGLNNMDEIPFSQVFIHPKIQDAFGETMSKSKGNGIDPLDVIEKFGADSLRYAMADLTTTDTQDVRLPADFECPNCEKAIPQTKKNRVLHRVECPDCKKPFRTQWAESEEDLALPRGTVLSERFEFSRNFGNKLWNASRFAMMRMENCQADSIEAHDLTVEDQWLLSRLSTVCESVTEKLESYAYGEATREIYKFAWDEFCSFYIEMLKGRLDCDDSRPQAQRMLAYALDCLLRLLHPFMPFITEEIWQNLNQIAPTRGFKAAEAPSECLITASWPSVNPEFKNEEIERQFALFQSSLGAIREIRNSQNVPPKKQVEFVLRCDDSVKSMLTPLSPYYAVLANANLRAMGPDVTVPEINATRAIAQQEIFVDLDGLIDVEAETKKLEKEEQKILGQISGKQNKLKNEKFVNSAPAEIVDRERNSLAKLEEQLQTIRQALERFKK
jgi:valyl-tRNA synthetase